MCFFCFFWFSRTSIPILILRIPNLQRLSPTLMMKVQWKLLLHQLSGKREWWGLFLFSAFLQVYLCCSVLVLIWLHFFRIKGLPNGVNHEKKGNKRPFAEERLDFYLLANFVIQNFISLLCLYFGFSFIEDLIRGHMQ